MVISIYNYRDTDRYVYANASLFIAPSLKSPFTDTSFPQPYLCHIKPAFRGMRDTS
jgi:hypothetical protein